MQRVSDKAKLGDVINKDGDIFVRNPSLEQPEGIGILTKGTVLVTEEQAEAAKAFGWRMLNTGKWDAGLVEITRGVSSLLN